MLTLPTFQAARSLCRAAHLAPDEEELHLEDLPWVLSLRRQKESMSLHLKAAQDGGNCTQQEPPQLVELDSMSAPDHGGHQLQPWSHASSQQLDAGQCVDRGEGRGEASETKQKTLKRLPKHYIYMRS